MNERHAPQHHPNRREVGLGDTREDFDAALARCRAALLDSDSDDLDAEWSVIAAFAAAARNADVPPQRLLAVFKHMAAALPMMLRLTPDERAERVRAMSAVAIDVYYDSQDGDGSSSTAHAGAPRLGAPELRAQRDTEQH